MVLRLGMRRLRCQAAFLFVVLLAGVAAAGQSFDATKLSAPMDLRGTWRVEASDNPEYKRPDFDDSHWHLFDVGNSIDRLFPKRPSLIWYRLHVKVDPGMSGLALSEINIA